MIIETYCEHVVIPILKASSLYHTLLRIENDSGLVNKTCEVKLAAIRLTVLHSSFMYYMYIYTYKHQNEENCGAQVVNVTVLF